MSTEIAIQTQGLCKYYRFYRHPADILYELVTRRPRYIEHAALQDITFDLKRGEIVGILGRNGAGKSTLLKIIAGTLQRSTGELKVNGRVTAILELGTGFHPDYTGRENIYMGGLCLGMSRGEIEKKIDDIIQFSDLNEFIDQPFKTYSTGMQARLTFSTAISVDPDIMIVDEALSVGDARFQLKCFARLQALRQKRTTILLVSHDINTITMLCDRAIILENGKIYAEGNVKEVSILYHNLLFGDQSLEIDKQSTTPTETCKDVEEDSISIDNVSAKISDTTDSSVNALRYGIGGARLLDWGLLNKNGERCTIIESGSACRLFMTFHCDKDIEDLSCGFAIKDRRGTVLWGVTNLSQEQLVYKAFSGEKLTVIAECVMWLADGNYFITLGAAHLSDGKKIDFIEDAIEFQVIGTRGIFTTSIVNLQTTLNIQSNKIKQEEMLT